MRYLFAVATILLAAVGIAWELGNVEPLLKPQYPFEALQVSVDKHPEGSTGNTRQLHYELRFRQLPQKDTMYTISYAAYDRRYIDDNHLLGTGKFVDYLKQQDTTLYQTAPETRLYDQIFVAGGTVSGTINLRSNAEPAYLFVSVAPHREEGGSIFGNGYFVPIRQ